MAVTLSASNFSAIGIGVGATTVQVQIPTDVPSGAAIVLVIHNRTDETTTLSSVADPVNGTWDGSTVRQGPSDNTGGTIRSWIVALLNSAALSGAGNRLITITFSGAINSQSCGGWVSSDQGALEFDAVATFAEGTVSSTAWATGTVTTSGAGVTFGLAATNNSQAGDPTVGGGDTLLTANSAGQRVFIVGRTHASGNQSYSATLASTSLWNAHALALKEPVASATLTPAQAALTLNGRTPTTSAFQNVRIREVLVNASGQPQGNLTGISLLVWYRKSPWNAPDLSYSDMTTDANGTASWSILTGTLAYGDPVFYVAGHSTPSFSAWTCAQVIPSYE